MDFLLHCKNRLKNFMHYPVNTAISRNDKIYKKTIKPKINLIFAIPVKIFSANFNKRRFFVVHLRL